VSIPSKRSVARLAAIAALAAAAASAQAQPAGVNAQRILIGQSTPLTGANAELGNDIRNGALAYFRKVNEAGGVHGRKVELASLDDDNKVPRAEENTKKLVEEQGVFALFGYGEVVARAMPAAYSFLTLVLLFFTVRHFYGRARALAAIVVLSGKAGGLGGVTEVSWYYLLGGLLGAVYVATALVAVSSIGAGGVAAATVTAQLIASLAIDRLGLFGLDQIAITPERMFGVVLLLVGTVLVVR